MLVLFLSALSSSLLGASVSRLAAALAGVPARIVFGIGPRVGRKVAEPGIDVRPGLFWCWTKLLDGRGARAHAVRASGPIAMALVPFALLVIAMMTVGVPRPQEGPPLIVGEVAALSPAAEAGVLPGDRIVALDGRATPDVSALRAELGDREEPRELTVERGDRRLELPIVPTRRIDGQVVIGIVMPMGRAHPGVVDAVALSAREVVGWWRGTVAGIAQAFSDDVLSPVGVVARVYDFGEAALVLLLVAASAMSMLWASIAALAELVLAFRTRRSRAPVEAASPDAA